MRPDGNITLKPLIGIPPGVGTKSLKGKEYTDKLMSAINGYKPKTFTGQYGSQTKPFAQYLQRTGVDISKFDENDLLYLLEQRKRALNTTKPFDSTTSWTTDNGSTIFRDVGDQTVGKLILANSNNGFQVVDIAKTPGAPRGMSRHLYDSGIKIAKAAGREGIDSGRALMSPEITTYVWDKYYPNRKIIGNYGIRFEGMGRDVKHPINFGQKTNQDVVRLTQPSQDVIVKEYNLFHPSIIKNGKVTVDWKNKDPFKVLIPGTVGYGLHENSQ